MEERRNGKIREYKKNQNLDLADNSLVKKITRGTIEKN
jgi:hypothetical protein